MSSISIGPRETIQPVHADDQVIGLARPHKAVVCNTMWALSDFTIKNGRSKISNEIGKKVNVVYRQNNVAKNLVRFH